MTLRGLLAAHYCAALLFSMNSALAGLPGANLPQSVRLSLSKANIGDASFGIFVGPAESSPLLQHGADSLFHPASTMKLLTTVAALDILGKDFRFRTEVFLTGRYRKGVLDGDLVIRAANDPSFRYDDLRELVKRVHRMGVRDITGDVILDRSLYAARLVDQSPLFGEIDNPFNSPPDALALQYKAVLLALSPNVKARRVVAELRPQLQNIRLAAEEIALTDGKCPADLRQQVSIEHVGGAESAEIRVRGAFPAACGPRAYYVSVLSYGGYFAAAFAKLWQEAGGTIGGSLREVFEAPGKTRLLTVWESPPLISIVHEINKTSNNLMARQLFLELGVLAPPEILVVRRKPAKPKQPKTAEELQQEAEDRVTLYTTRANLYIRKWLADNDILMPGLVLENGSGLSSNERITPRSLVRLLQYVQTRSYAREFTETLPIAGVDGTLRMRLKESAATGAAMLKTGTLNDVRALAGYIRDLDDKLQIFVFLVNDKNAGAATWAQDKLVEEVRLRHVGIDATNTGLPK